MKFQNCILINFVTDARTEGQGESNMPLQLFQSWGHPFNVSKVGGITKDTLIFSLAFFIPSQ